MSKEREAEILRKQLNRIGALPDTAKALPPQGVDYARGSSGR